MHCSSLLPILLLGAFPAAPETHGHFGSGGFGFLCPCAIENPEWLPREYTEAVRATLFPPRHFAAASLAGTPASRSAFTLQAVEIDPLGADPATPWYVHVASLRVRDQPNVAASTQIGSLSRDSTVVGTYYLVVETDEEWLGFDFEGTTGYISRLGFSRIHPANEAMIAAHVNLPIGQEIVNRWWGVPLDYEPTDLFTIPPRFTNEVPGRDYRLRGEPLTALVAMLDAALADGEVMVVSSPYRSGAAQQSLFLSAMNNSGFNQRFSAPPGHSEHQLGTTVDLFNLDAGRFINSTDSQYQWMLQHGNSYGFVQSYRADNTEETGYVVEPWHWRYFGGDSSVGLDWRLF